MWWGFRSILVAENLQKMGYGRVVSVDGGFRAGVMPDTLSNPDLFEGERLSHMTKCRLTFTICRVKRKRRSVH